MDCGIKSRKRCMQNFIGWRWNNYQLSTNFLHDWICSELKHDDPNCRWTRQMNQWLWGPFVFDLAGFVIPNNYGIPIFVFVCLKGARPRAWQPTENSRQLFFMFGLLGLATVFALELKYLFEFLFQLLHPELYNNLERLFPLLLEIPDLWQHKTKLTE